MPIKRIEKIKDGVVVQRAERSDKHGEYECHAFGSNIDPIKLSSLDEVAGYLRANPKSGVRMNPGWSKISKYVQIDGGTALSDPLPVGFPFLGRDIGGVIILATSSMLHSRSATPVTAAFEICARRSGYVPLWRVHERLRPISEFEASASGQRDSDQ